MTNYQFLREYNLSQGQQQFANNDVTTSSHQTWWSSCTPTKIHSVTFNFSWYYHFCKWWHPHSLIQNYPKTLQVFSTHQQWNFCIAYSECLSGIINDATSLQKVSAKNTLLLMEATHTSNLELVSPIVISNVTHPITGITCPSKSLTTPSLDTFSILSAESSL